MDRHTPKLAGFLNPNIPILPETFLTFASKGSIGPSYAAHAPYTQCTLNAMKWGQYMMETVYPILNLNRKNEKEETKPVQTLKSPPPLREGLNESYCLYNSGSMVRHYVHGYWFFEPTCATAQWAHMHRFPSVCLVVTWPKIQLENNSYLREFCSYLCTFIGVQANGS